MVTCNAFERSDGLDTTLYKMIPMTSRHFRDLQQVYDDERRCSKKTKDQMER